MHLDRLDTSATPGFEGGKNAGKKLLENASGELRELQEKLFADAVAGGQKRVLLVLQGMDTAGKGGIVNHVVGAVDVQGVHLHAFKAPTKEELAHDFLWRVRAQLPAAGQIGVFDRSHYEDVLIGRVRHLASDEEIEKRYQAIIDFERELVAQGTTIVKVMLHISADAQRERLAARLDDPTKYWKFNEGDLKERALWNDYQRAYEIAIERTSTDEAPWFIVPADHKWYARIAVQNILIDAMSALKLDWPAADFDPEEQKRLLETEKLDAR